MMKLSLVFFIPFFAAAQESYSGPQVLQNKTLEHLTVHGPLSFEELTVKNESNIHGPTTGTKGDFSSLTVTGPVSLEKSKVDALKVTGPLELKDVAVRRSLVVIGPLLTYKSQLPKVQATADTLIFEDSELAGLELESNRTPEIVTLKGKTHVKGDIVFKSGKGTVLLDSSAKVDGKISGGTEKKL